MATVVMRNRVTSEYRKVEKDGDEFWALRAELHTDGRPRWEQTGEHDLAAFANRAEANRLRAEDIGDQDQPVQMVVEAGGSSSVGLDRGWPTPGELEQGAGRAADMSDEEIATASAIYGGGSIVEGYPAGHPPQVNPEEAEEAGVSLGGGLSGSHDVPEEKTNRVQEAQSGAVEDQPKAEDPTEPGNTSPKAPAGNEAPTSVYKQRSPSQLRAEIEKRNATRSEEDKITVPENARKARLIRALERDDTRSQV